MSGSLDDACQVLLDLDARISKAEAYLKDIKAQRHSLATETLPALMAEVGFDKVVKGDREITLREYVSGSIPKDPEKRQAALRWLEAHDGAGLIKSEIKAPFPKSEHKVAVALYSRLEAEGHPVSLDESVHPSTLQAWVRSRMREGAPVDTDTLGVSIGSIVKVSSKS